MIECKRVTFNYNKHTVLHDINLTFSSQQKIGIVGESGSGKTTLAHLILGMLKPTAGEINKHGLTMLPIFQNAYDSFNPKRTIQQSMDEAIKYYYQDATKALTQRLDELLVLMGLDSNLLKRRPEELSGGQLQRLNMIRSFVLEPDILICDEITANLDVISENKMKDILEHYHQLTRKGLMIISHDIAFLQALVDRIVVLKDGYIVDDFMVKDMFADSRNAYTKKLLSLY
ncbi:ATP-binding cassette domain-containing protein [Staphylococcus gallinarum]|jgi:peptide/nickel transport system ATP-binding protein|uniref:ATP-binding cassette domain-containing protein n=1 Tax=Staphylococcus gallinarum TaxID=1293 RepID=A0A2T4T0B7_STAGA|nr:ATP-binding cassette domain-containing protein [Staphylococcus gallinarum]MCD8821902.1 ATP-binding cassette domain-containing protein [Staphylococcus gallinarum]MCD8826727.1 ATP-binding cassette domain-containing protein [Staphylococcus gallinarum]MCD8844541.1 ATP-binding cassette domain-containing protein [Staphylococcus gallinarum]MCD8870947.1 ATP-binding cassette domain-containing protein [Staphylococcus gallinarum]MCQ9288503.1 ATP-binding cassette domain-containing protein [Staphylococc